MLAQIRMLKTKNYRTASDIARSSAYQNPTLIQYLGNVTGSDSSTKKTEDFNITSACIAATSLKKSPSSSAVHASE